MATIDAAKWAELLKPYTVARDANFCEAEAILTENSDPLAPPVANMMPNFADMLGPLKSMLGGSGAGKKVASQRGADVSADEPARVSPEASEFLDALEAVLFQRHGALSAAHTRVAMSHWIAAREELPF